MSYKITSLERLSRHHLEPGWARWIMLVDFWEGDNEAVKVTDRFVADFRTQKLGEANGDDWSLASKPDTVLAAMTGIAAGHEPRCLAVLRSGRRGDIYIPDQRPDQHGTLIPNDPIAHDPKVRAEVGRAVRR